MTKLWCFLENDEKGWRESVLPDSVNIFEVADHFNSKYITRHYWISSEKPGEEELNQIRREKEDSGNEFVDSFRKAGELV